MSEDFWKILQTLDILTLVNQEGVRQGVLFYFGPLWEFPTNKMHTNSYAHSTPVPTRVCLLANACTQTGAAGARQPQEGSGQGLGTRPPAPRPLHQGTQIWSIAGQLRGDRQTVMWSATWPPGVQRLAQEYLTRPAKVVANDVDRLAGVCGVLAAGRRVG